MSAAPRQLSENDHAEIEKFRLYLQACGRWDQEHDIDGDPLIDLEGVEWRKKQIKAHAAIYAQIYGEKP